MFGRQFPFSIDFDLGTEYCQKPITQTDYLKKLLPKLEMSRQLAQENVNKQQARYKHIYTHQPHTTRKDITTGRSTRPEHTPLTQDHESSRGLPKLAHNEIIYLNTAKEIMVYEIYFIKHYL